MVMKGVQAYGATEAIIKGIKAGLDMFIFRDADEQTKNAIEELVKIAEKDENLKQKIIKSNERISKLKNRFCI